MAIEWLTHPCVISQILWVCGWGLSVYIGSYWLFPPFMGWNVSSKRCTGFTTMVGVRILHFRREMLNLLTDLNAHIALGNVSHPVSLERWPKEIFLIKTSYFLEIRVHERLLSEIMWSFTVNNVTDRRSLHIAGETVPLPLPKYPLLLVPRNSKTKAFKMECLFQQFKV